MAVKEKTKKAKNIGIEVALPSKTCDDQNCPFHGYLKVRGRIFDGRVVSKKEKSVSVEWDYLHFVKKYERSERRKTRVTAHMPPCMDVSVGDKVRIAECRPLSKTKNFVLIEKI
jgi:small subunit ribosomal protein S17